MHACMSFKRREKAITNQKEKKLKQKEKKEREKEEEDMHIKCFAP